MSLKIKLIAEEIAANNKDYKIFPRKLLMAYIRETYNCSSYLANKVIKSLLETEDKSDEDEKTTD